MYDEVSRVNNKQLSLVVITDPGMYDEVSKVNDEPSSCVTIGWMKYSMWFPIGHRENPLLQKK